jgi:hypothetical protein
MKIKVIITGSTGMVGEGVLIASLQHPDVESVLIINRRPSGVVHPKLKEIIHTDFSNISSIADQVTGYDACFFCLGVSSIGLNEEKYTLLTYTLTLGFAKTLAEANLNSLTFCYISGAGTDSTEKGKSMWARVKGKTENDLSKLPFKKVYNFRPGGLKATKGQKHVLSYYKYFSWLIPILQTLTPNFVSTLQDLGLAMIKVAISGYPKHILEVKDINSLGKSTTY